MASRSEKMTTYGGNSGMNGGDEARRRLVPQEQPAARRAVILPETNDAPKSNNRLSSASRKRNANAVADKSRVRASPENPAGTNVKKKRRGKPNTTSGAPAPPEIHGREQQERPRQADVSPQPQVPRADVGNGMIETTFLQRLFLSLPQQQPPFVVRQEQAPPSAGTSSSTPLHPQTSNLLVSMNFPLGLGNHPLLRGPTTSAPLLYQQTNATTTTQDGAAAAAAAALIDALRSQIGQQQQIRNAQQSSDVNSLVQSLLLQQQENQGKQEQLRRILAGGTTIATMSSRPTPTSLQAGHHLLSTGGGAGASSPSSFATSPIANFLLASRQQERPAGAGSQKPETTTNDAPMVQVPAVGAGAGLPTGSSHHHALAALASRPRELLLAILQQQHGGLVAAPAHRTTTTPLSTTSSSSDGYNINASQITDETRTGRMPHHQNSSLLLLSQLRTILGDSAASQQQVVLSNYFTTPAGAGAGTSLPSAQHEHVAREDYLTTSPRLHHAAGHPHNNASSSLRRKEDAKKEQEQFMRPPATARSLGSDGFPIDLPTLLALPEDHHHLSPHQVFLRQHIEAFRASERDTSTHKRGRNKQISVQQVGIRCRHCAHIPVSKRQKGSTYFPATLSGLYQAAQNMSSMHLQCGLCSEMPEGIRQKFAFLISTKGVSSGAGRPYWEKAAQKIGLVDSPIGIRFVRDEQQHDDLVPVLGPPRLLPY